MSGRRHHSTARRQALQRLAASASVLTLAGCGRRDDPRGPLNFWAMGREAEVVAELLPAFKARHPQIEVRVQQLPWTAAHEKLLTAYAGGSLPDLCQLGNTWLPELTALDALEPLATKSSHLLRHSRARQNQPVFASQPPLKPARSRPRRSGGQRRMSSQTRSLR